MNRKVNILTLLVLSSLICLQCSKPTDPPVTPPVTSPPVTTPPVTTPPVPPDGPDFTVDGKWECTIDGVPWSGTVDTSFVQIVQTDSRTDTVINCTGTSNDKKANIYFLITINRHLYPGNTISLPNNGCAFIFDTLTRKYFGSYPYFNGVTYQVDSVNGKKYKGSFAGTAKGSNKTHTIANGRFSCEFGKGNNEPKLFSMNIGNNVFAGYFHSAKLYSNTLTMEGAHYNFYDDNRFRLLVRTGGTVKTGTYTSSNGDVSLQYFSGGSVGYYITDSTGDLSLTITSVNNGIVEGIFSGKTETGTPLTKGTFRCRLKDYTAQTDSPDKWGFGAGDYNYLYSIYGGNVLNAVKSMSGGRYVVTINGESDQDASVFRIVLSSTTALDTGTYANGGPQFILPRSLDSFYLRSSVWIDDRAQISYWAGTANNVSNPTTWCIVDAIDDKHISGRLMGQLFAGSVIFTNAIDVVVEVGKFQASF